jgi:hypothetical protein
VKINLNIPAGEKQRDFLDYLNSALRKRMPSFRGEAGRDEDGNFVSCTAEFNSVPTTERNFSVVLRDLKIIQ